MGAAVPPVFSLSSGSPRPLFKNEPCSRDSIDTHLQGGSMGEATDNSTDMSVTTAILRTVHDRCASIAWDRKGEGDNVDGFRPI